jgi:dTDP-4-dehydrorhamnose 3,5-epimerase
MKVVAAALDGVLLLEPIVHQDHRGFFLETYHQQKYERAGIPETFVQDNRSSSTYGTLRGLHAQKNRPQGKLVQTVDGEIFDVAVDIRKGSPTFGKWVGYVLSAENFRQLYVPPGFLHGFCVTSERAQVEYKCTDFYDPEGEFGVLWNDPDLAIAWPIKNPTVSVKDGNLPRLFDLPDLR